MMKFFTRELLAKVNDCDPKIRGDAERQWKENDLCYSRQFESVKKHLPRFFVKEFLRRSGLHDYEIANISFLQRGRFPGKRYRCFHGEFAGRYFLRRDRRW